MIYEAETIIKKSRANLKELMGWHEKWLKSNGKQGAFCFNYNELQAQSLMSDAEIIQYFVNEGYNVANAEKYIGEKKEKE